MNNIEERIKEIIAECAEDIDINELNDDTKLLSEGIIGSFEIIQIIALLENEFDVCVPVNEIEFEEFETIKKIVGIVERIISEK